MRLDSISSIAEITPYYGTLDETFRMMNTLCMRTRKMWNNCKLQLQKNIQRRGTECGLRYASRLNMLLKNPFLSMLFHDDYLCASREKEYKSLMIFLNQIKEPQMLTFMKLYLSSKRDFSITFSTIEDYRRVNELCFSKHYIQTIDKMKEIKVDYYKVNSYAFVEDLPMLYDCKFIHKILFVCEEYSKCEDYIKIWKQFKESSQCEVPNIYLIWKSMSILDFNSLISSFEDASVTIV